MDTGNGARNLLDIDAEGDKTDYDERMSKFSIFHDLWQFLRIRKKWWLLPMVLVIILLGMLLVFAQTSPFAPFIYTLV